MSYIFGMKSQGRPVIATKHHDNRVEIEREWQMPAHSRTDAVFVSYVHADSSGQPEGIMIGVNLAQYQQTNITLDLASAKHLRNVLDRAIARHEAANQINQTRV